MDARLDNITSALIHAWYQLPKVPGGAVIVAGLAKVIFATLLARLRSNRTRLSRQGNALGALPAAQLHLAADTMY